MESNSNKSVLIVDDNELNVDLLQNMLERANYTLYTALNGEDAIKLADEHLPSIVLLDINMPGISGYEVCEKIKANPETADIPVIFISALDDTDDIVKAFDAGGVDYITKPFKFREVLARVHTQVTISEQKREIERMRDRERQQFERVDALRAQFIGSATHDLKNPLFIISGYADMLGAHATITESERLTGFVQAIKRGVDKMGALVADMLELLQLQTDVTLNRTDVELALLLKQVTQDMRIRAREKDIDLNLELPGESVSIKVDVRRIGRVFENLISNAIKYTPEGGRVDVIATTHDDTVTIAIEDTGLGIPEDVLPDLFQPFQRVNTEEHMQQEGTGLGLSIVKALTEQHDGTVNVTSQLGEGSRFTVTLPRQ